MQHNEKYVKMHIKTKINNSRKKKKMKPQKVPFIMAMFDPVLFFTTCVEKRFYKY